MSERKYTQEFKKESVLLVTEQGYSARQAAKSIGVPYNTFICWVREYKQHKESAFPGKGRLRPEEDEIRRLKKQVVVVHNKYDLKTACIQLFHNIFNRSFR